MALEVWAERGGLPVRVGAFSDGRPEERVFSYAESYLSSPGAVALCPSLPLCSGERSRNIFEPFFSGLIPEGPMREELARRFHVAQSDYLGLLEYLGEECIGAIRFRDSANAASEPGLKALTEDDVRQLAQDALGFATRIMGASRLSLSGAQTKIGLFLSKGEDPATVPLQCWHLPLGSAPSTHIVKIAAADDGLVANESACMEAARRCGIEVAATCVPAALPNCLVSERFDRSWDVPCEAGGRSVPARLHQVDFCQALGYPGYAKYEFAQGTCYAAECADLIRRESYDPVADVRTFVRQLVFDYAVGNCDSHLKNHALLYSPSWAARRLAPAYDIVCTTVLGYQRELGIDIGVHRAIDEVTEADLQIMALNVGIPVRRLVEDVERILVEAPGALGELAGSSGPTGRVAQAILADMAPRLKVLEKFCVTA